MWAKGEENMVLLPHLKKLLTLQEMHYMATSE